MKTIGINGFVRRQTKDSPFSYYDGPFEDIIKMLDVEAVQRQAKDGVALMWVPEEGFHCGVVAIEESDQLVATFESRRPGEAPVIVVRAKGRKVQARGVEVVLYHHDKLGDDATTECDWELISINARTWHTPEPPTPVAMARNYLGLEGGTKREYTADEFAQSIAYWSNKAMCVKE